MAEWNGMAERNAERNGMAERNDGTEWRNGMAERNGGTERRNGIRIKRGTERNGDKTMNGAKITAEQYKLLRHSF